MSKSFLHVASPSDANNINMSCVMFSCVEGGYYRADVIWQYRRDVPPFLTLHHLTTRLVGTPEPGRPQIAEPKWSLFRAVINSYFVIRPVRAKGLIDIPN